MLLHLIDRVGVESKATLMIGDTTHDVEVAHGAGAAAVAVAYGAHDADSLAQRSPLALVGSIAELHGWLRANA
jgi:phosphoglycolate phosphatase